MKTFNISICYIRYVEITDETIDLLLGALADQLQALGSHVEIVVIGGSALTALGLVRRATRDVDLLAIAENGELRLAEPLPQALLAARATVAADFGLAEDWLNPGPTDLLKWGLPEAFMSRPPPLLPPPTIERSTPLAATARWSITKIRP